MTAVMRAAAVPTAARVPRVALVIDGRIVDERLFREAAAISVGTAEDASFTLPRRPGRGTDAAGAPERFVLLERVGSKHYLRFCDGMTGRVAMGNDRIDVAALRARAHESRGAWRVELSDDARGKIVIFGATVLFQIVPAPPLPTRPHLPLGVLDGVGAQVDWRLAIIAAMSFLLHFALVGGAYSDWMDPVVDADRTVAAVIDMKRSLPELQVEEPAQPTADAPTKSEPEKQARAAPAKDSGATGPKTRGPVAAKRGSISNDHAADLAARADAMEMGMIASLNGGPATKAAIDRGEIPPVDLASAAQSAKGVAERGGGLDTSRGGAPLNAGKSGLADLAPGTRGSANQNAGPARDVGGPVANVDIRPPTMSGAGPSDADRVVLGLRARFRKCYQDGLNKDPSMSGKAVLAAKVAPNGEVSSVDVVENAGLSADVTSCMQRVVRGATFTGSGAFATIRIPVTFVQQK